MKAASVGAGEAVCTPLLYVLFHFSWSLFLFLMQAFYLRLGRLELLLVFVLLLPLAFRLCIKCVLLVGVSRMHLALAVGAGEAFTIRVFLHLLWLLSLVLQTAFPLLLLLLLPLGM